MDAVAKLRNIRTGLSGVTELLLALLDDLDGDPDLEDGDNDAAVDDDRCDEADSGDDEPSLGGPTYGYEVDLEHDNADDEDGGDTELNGDESDYNGDEGDFSAGRLPGGSGL